MAESKTPRKKAAGFTAEERAAMKERAQELKAEERWKKNRAEGERAVLEKLAEMKGCDRVLGERLHELIKETAPELLPRTWYGMPAYTKDGKVLCFFQSAGKFGARYATLGFNDTAKLDDGALWPTSFALAEWTPAVEKKVRALVKKAAR